MIDRVRKTAQSALPRALWIDRRSGLWGVSNPLESLFKSEPEFTAQACTPGFVIRGGVGGFHLSLRVKHKWYHG